MIWQEGWYCQKPWGNRFSFLVTSRCARRFFQGCKYYWDTMFNKVAPLKILKVESNKKFGKITDSCTFPFLHLVKSSRFQIFFPSQFYRKKNGKSMRLLFPKRFVAQRYHFLSRYMHEFGEELHRFVTSSGVAEWRGMNGEEVCLKTLKTSGKEAVGEGSMIHETGFRTIYDIIDILWYITVTYSYTTFDLPNIWCFCQYADFCKADQKIQVWWTMNDHDTGPGNLNCGSNKFPQPHIGWLTFQYSNS